MSDLTDLQTVKSQAIARLKEITLTKKPSYDVDGQRVSWTEYHKMLTEQLKELNELIEYEQYGESGEGWEERTQAFT